MTDVLKDPAKFFEFVTGFAPHSYQVAFLTEKSRLVAVRAGRKVGKTTMCAVKALYQAMTKEKQEILIVAPYWRQSNYLFWKILDIVHDVPLIRESAGETVGLKETQTEIHFVTGSKIYCLPGRKVETISGFNPNIIIVDEAADVPEEVLSELESSFFATAGQLFMVGTPRNPFGKFYDAFREGSGFKTYHISALNCPHISKEAIQTYRKRYTETEYKMKVLGEFVELSDNFFSAKLVDECAEDIEEIDYPEPGGIYRLAVDFARYGEDETVYMIGEVLGDTMKVVKIISTSKKPLSDAIGRIKELHDRFAFGYIYLDETGIGSGAVDILTGEGLPVIAKKFTFQARQEYYTNLRTLMEFGKVKYPKSANKLIKQLKSLKQKFTERGVQIFPPKGHHDDHPDTLALLCSDMRIYKEAEKEEGFVF